MAPQHRRRSTRALDELPGLFDDVDSQFRAPDPRSHASASGFSEVEIEAEPVKPARTLQFISFGSGSSGNCAYLGIAGEGGVIIDAGVGSDKVIGELKRNCIPLDRISGIILTHDHGDHIRYAYNLLREIPRMLLYCTPRTLTGIFTRHRVSRRIREYHKPIYKEFAFQAGPFMITPFETSHDGSDNVGFCVTAGERNFVITTDTGIITDRADHYMRKANYLMIESNYDAAMLAAGLYPEYLKARIRGDKGHLNNTVTASYLASMWSEHLTDIFLCHLSHDNNRPEIARRVTAEALEAKGITVGDATGSLQSREAQVQLSVLPRFESSPLHIFRI